MGKGWGKRDGVTVWRKESGDINQYGGMAAESRIVSAIAGFLLVTSALASLSEQLRLSSSESIS